jgi:hypothetical protein
VRRRSGRASRADSNNSILVLQKTAREPPRSTDCPFCSPQYPILRRSTCTVGSARSIERGEDTKTKEKPHSQSDRTKSDYEKRRTRPVWSQPTSGEAIGNQEFLLGGRTRARTWDPLIKSQLLYQLSYAPGSDPETATARGRRLAKRPPDVQQACGLFPVRWRPGNYRKMHRIPAPGQPQAPTGGGRVDGRAEFDRSPSIIARLHVQSG